MAIVLTSGSLGVRAATSAYAVVVIAIVAALLPGVDPVTTLIEMVPMLFLYELGIVLSAWTTRLSRTEE